MFCCGRCRFRIPKRWCRLADILQGADVGGNGEAGVTAPDIQNYTRDTHSFESLGGYRQGSYELSGIGEPAQVNSARLSGGVFPALQVEPLIGRYFTQQEDDQKEQVAVVSYSLWQNRLHGNPQAVLGTKILLDRKPYVVIGVMPRNFEFPLVPGHLNSSELWIPMSFDPHAGARRERSGRLEFQHGGAAQARNHRGAGAERCATRGRGDDARAIRRSWRACISARSCALCTKKR